MVDAVVRNAATVKKDVAESAVVDAVPVVLVFTKVAPLAERLVVDAVKRDEDAAIKLVVDAVVIFATVAARSVVVAFVAVRLVVPRVVT